MTDEMRVILIEEEMPAIKCAINGVNFYPIVLIEYTTKKEEPIVDFVKVREFLQSFKEETIESLTVKIRKFFVKIEEIETVRVTVKSESEDHPDCEVSI